MLAAIWLAWAGDHTSAAADSNAFRLTRPGDGIIVYDQPHNLTGTLFQSSWWDPDGSDYDQYVWDDFTLNAPHDISEIRWRGGYDPTHFGMGGSVISFTVAIYPSIAAGIQPDVINPPLARYETGNGGETPAGRFGATAMYDYAFVLPRPFHAEPGVKYWVQIEGWQHGIPDWGLAAGTGGNGSHFVRAAGIGDFRYYIGSGDAAFTLLALGSSSPTDTPTPTTLPTDTPTPPVTPNTTATPMATAAPAALLYLPLISRAHAP